MAGTRQINTEKQKSFKVIVITEANRLSKDAQHALRRTMEKYMASCRLILMTESVSKLIPALRSRCLGVRVSAPTESEIEMVLEKVSMAEMFEMSDEQKRNLAKGNKIVGKYFESNNIQLKVSGRNLRKALLQAEVSKVKSSQEAPAYDWELYLRGELIL